MIEFTLRSYANFLEQIKASCDTVVRFDEFLSGSQQKPRFCILRHDVDRKPRRALQMAQLESSMGLHASYYFRAKPFVCDPQVIRKIRQLGHEIGYHYECLADTRGNLRQALKNFELNLHKMRKIAPVRTIAMHGRPFSPHDSRMMWISCGNRRLLKQRFNILGEIYLDIDYRDIAYINDTGRNWYTAKSNLRDHVASSVITDFNSDGALLAAIKENRFDKLVFQAHPERWTDDSIGYITQWGKDLLINAMKQIK